MINVNFIGCGRVGKTLARLIRTHQLGTIRGVLNAHRESSLSAVDFIGEGVACASFSELPLADVYFITTRDTDIEPTCQALVTQATLPAKAIVIHCCGALSSDILQAAHAKGYFTASVHPLKSFVDPKVSVDTFAGTYCSYEGDQDTYPTIQHLFSGMGAKLFEIQKNKKSLYHLAAVMANNYLVTLHHVATQCFQSAGADESTAFEITTTFMKETLRNLTESTHQAALTGPIQRGDIVVIQQHLAALKDLPDIKKIYQALAKATIEITSHPEKLKKN